MTTEEIKAERPKPLPEYILTVIRAAAKAGWGVTLSLPSEEMGGAPSLTVISNWSSNTEGRWEIADASSAYDCLAAMGAETVQAAVTVYIEPDAVVMALCPECSGMVYQGQANGYRSLMGFKVCDTCGRGNLLPTMAAAIEVKG